MLAPIFNVAPNCLLILVSQMIIAMKCKKSKGFTVSRNGYSQAKHQRHVTVSSPRTPIMILFRNGGLSGMAEIRLGCTEDLELTTLFSD